MTEVKTKLDPTASLNLVEQAAAQGKLSATAVDNIRIWLTDANYADYAPQIMEHVRDGKWQILDDVFWTIIPFGTGGRRGRMYPFGSNAINHRTIGESAQGLADYVKTENPEGPWACGIAYDTRHRSREFAELCAGIMVANGFKVYFLDDYRSTPELSYLVRYKNCSCGIMVTASHNPPSDNAVKVYWSSGAQLIPPHDAGVIGCVEHVGQFEVAEFDAAVVAGKIELCLEELDAALLEEHKKQSFGGPRDLKVIFSPLHGVGEFNVSNLFQAVGFDDLEIYEPHREPNGDFPNVPEHVSNPENPAVFEQIIERAQEIGADLVLATDPDCDRMGAAAPLTLDTKGPWATLDGNQLGALLGDYILGKRKEQGQLHSDHYIITTLVTTMLTCRIAESYGVKYYNNNLVGFKWICDLMDIKGPENFVYGAEESHGYLVGQYCRDKDGAIACLLMSELAAEAKSRGQSVHEYLRQLHLDYGYHRERLINIRMEGSDGMKRMERLMGLLRESTPWSLGDINIKSMRDYDTLTRHSPDGAVEAFDGPKGNLIFLESDVDGNCVAIRPSGTEPKIKLYMFGYCAPEDRRDLEEIKTEVHNRLDIFEKELRAFADSVQ